MPIMSRHCCSKVATSSTDKCTKQSKLNVTLAGTWTACCSSVATYSLRWYSTMSKQSEGFDVCTSSLMVTWLGGDESTTAAASASKGASSVSSACKHAPVCWEHRGTETSKYTIKCQQDVRQLNMGKPNKSDYILQLFQRTVSAVQMCPRGIIILEGHQCRP